MRANHFLVKGELRKYNIHNFISTSWVWQKTEVKTIGNGDLKVSVMVQAGPKHEDFIFYPLMNKEVEKQPVRMGLYMVDCAVSSIFVATLNCMLFSSFDCSLRLWDLYHLGQ